MLNCFRASNPPNDLSIVKTTMIGFYCSLFVKFTHEQTNSNVSKMVLCSCNWHIDSKQMKVAIGQYNANDYIKRFTGGGNNDLETYNEQNYLF
jgi:hypothetical protein